MDVVIDGLSCILQRNDPVNGASDLQSWAWGSQSVGGIVAAIVGSVIVQYSEPRYSFLVYSLVAFGGAVTASRINRKVENIDL